VSACRIADWSRTDLMLVLRATPDEYELRLAGARVIENDRKAPRSG
jgi:hypothetical protein